MNRLSVEKRAKIVAHVSEGCSLRSTARLTGHDVNTVMWFVKEAGDAAAKYSDEILRGLNCTHIECDETWSFIYAKQKNVPKIKAHVPEAGDCYTWVAIDPKTKLVPSWHAGRREPSDAARFMDDLRSRVKGRIQLSTDGFLVYTPAIEGAFGDEVDYGWLVKTFAVAAERVEAKYSPPPLKAVRGSAVFGNPDPKRISTSIVERQNLTIRMSLRRCTRLTNGYSKKFENHKAALALYFFWYNFARIHSTIRCTPAMEAGISGHVWSYEEIVRLVPGN